MTPADEIRRELAAHERAVDELRAALAAAEAVERDEAILEALKLYDGSMTARAKALETDIQKYLGAAWSRERDLACLPATASRRRHALHRIARSRDGEGLKARRIFDIGRTCNRERVTLHFGACESRFEPERKNTP